MSDIAPIGRPSPAGPNSNGRVSHSTPPAAAPSRGDDRVELSLSAQLLSKLAELPEVRQDLVDRVKSQIANETYVTPDKVEAAIDSLREDLA